MKSELGLFQKTRLLWCETEKTWTKHVLTADKKKYVCGCGRETEYRVVKKP